MIPLHHVAGWLDEEKGFAKVYISIIYDYDGYRKKPTDRNAILISVHKWDYSLDHLDFTDHSMCNVTGLYHHVASLWIRPTQLQHGM